MKKHGEREDRLYNRALDIMDGYVRKGLWTPIMWHLALRGYTPAMTTLASDFSRDILPNSLDWPSDPFSAAGLYRRAFRKGEVNAAQNLAMIHFHLGELAKYRHWLRKAARAGHIDAAKEVKRFELRQPWRAARKIRRHRPFNRRDL